MAMDEARLNEIIAKAQLRQNERMKTETKGAARGGAEVGALVLPIDKQAQVVADIQAGRRDPGPDGNEMMSNLADSSHDMADVVANSVTLGQASRLRSAVQGQTMEQTNADSDAAKERLGPVMSTAGDIAGKAALGALFPPSMYETIPAAMATSAGLGVAGKLGDTLGRDKPAPTPGELLMTAGISAAGGLLGKYVGDRLGEVFARKMSEAGKTAATDKQLYKQVAERINVVKLQREAAKKAMEESGLTIRMSAIKETTDRLASGLQTRAAYRIGQLPYAKAAVQTLRKLQTTGDDISLIELNEIRGVIRDSIRTTNGSIADGVTSADRIATDLVDKQLKLMIDGLSKNPKAVGSGDVAKGVAGWQEMNKLTTQMKRADIIAGALDRADLAMKSTGVSFDRALSQQFKSLYNSRAARNEFRGAEAELLREMAEGTKLTQNLNKFDRIYGHGMFSQIYNTLARVPRGATSRAATQNARDVLGNLAPEAAVQSPSTMPGELGALIGGGTADDTIADQLKIVPK